MIQLDKVKIAFDASDVRTLFDYVPDTGAFTWRVTNSNRAPAGTPAGSSNGQVKVNGPNYRITHLIWAWMTGEFPPEGFEIDHRDNDPTNNRWENLRLATRQQQTWNTRKPRTNTTGFKGVTFDKERRKFKAQIIANGRKINLGRFATGELAHYAYKRAARRHFGRFARTV
jgi:hypothetical protein